jgi:glutathione synthase/RimK-type ligase-like ATP-grasp enzyme
MPEFDITLLTQRKFLTAEPGDDFTEDLLKEDRLLTAALEKRGLKVTRTNWDNPDFDWSSTGHVIFRTPWDYFSRFDEFSPWMERASKVTKFINPLETILWNIDKHYMLDLEKAGINMPATVFVEPESSGSNDMRSLAEIAGDAGWNEFILKPAVSGGAWHTYLVDQNNIREHEEIFRELIKDKCMLLQEYQRSISDKGEVSFIVLGGKFTHAILKKSKPGDFRVQANHGGTIEDYLPSKEEINFAEDIIKKSNVEIAYARVDVLWDNNNELCLCELELFEPELWFRKHNPAAEVFADTILRTIN